MIGVALAATPVTASPATKSLPGVSDKETTIPQREIKNVVHGHGDVVFVQGRTRQWYRVQLNENCARGVSNFSGLVFRHHGPSQQIDRFTTVVIPGERRNCAIQSIRESQPPPQVDSKSVVTLE